MVIFFFFFFFLKDNQISLLNKTLCIDVLSFLVERDSNSDSLFACLTRKVVLNSGNFFFFPPRAGCKKVLYLLTLANIYIYLFSFVRKHTHICKRH